MSVKDPDKFDADTYKAALAHDSGLSMTRWVATSLVVALAVVVSGITYCSTRPSERMQCVKAGGSWMPIITEHDIHNDPIYTDACVRPGMAGLVPKGLPQ